MNKRLLLPVIMLCCFQFAYAGWIERRTISNDGAVVTKGLSQVLTEPETENGKASVVITRLPASLLEEGKNSTGIFEEVFYRQNALPERLQAYLKTISRKPITIADSEVRTLVNQGPVNNRINLTIVGDGYTLAEKSKFFDDAKRLSNDLFVGHTFATYLPLFNVHAVFVPSRESGLSDRTQKDTALGLYRSPPGSKRGIMVGNNRAADDAVSLAPKTDFPILMANDDYYGGLGGAYAITTRSVRSGMIVLRHELGHNFGAVGEEYDGGQVYVGANHASDKTGAWKQWLTPGGSQIDHLFLSGYYVWQDLSKKTFSANFEVPASVATLRIELSSVGWETADDVWVKVDGQKGFLSGEFTSDRSFFDVMLDKTLAPGKHTLEISENIHDHNNVLAFANIYGLPDGYDAKSGQISAYKTFYGPGQGSGYRPTHDTCLMANMLSTRFCAVDTENMWIRFLNRVSLIDAIEKAPQRGGTSYTVKTPALSGLAVTWERLNGSEWVRLPELDQKITIALPDAVREKYRVRVAYKTDEVRNYSPAFNVVREIN